MVPGLAQLVSLAVLVGPLLIAPVVARAVRGRDTDLYAD